MQFGNSCSYIGRFAVDVIATTAYGLKVEPHKDKNNQFVAMAKEIFDKYEFNIGYIIARVYTKM